MNFPLIILFFLLSLNSIAQPKIWREYYERNGFCGYSLTLYRDHTYIYETGCEGRSHVNFGSWSKSKKNIELVPFDSTQINSNITVIEGRIDPDRTDISIQIVDAYNRPIENFSVMLIPKIIDHTFIDVKSDLTLQKEGSEDIELKLIFTDTSGFVTIPYPNEGVLKLIELVQIFKETRVFQGSDFTSNNITLKINLHNELFNYPSVKWFELPVYRVICDRRTFEFVLPAVE
jgi:hypothetical protein